MNETFTSQPFGSQVASQRRRRPRCPQCGSNRFRRDPGTSLVVCDSGHVLQGFRDEETQDGDEFNSSRMQMHRRSLKRQGIERNRRVGRKRMSVATRGVWYGARSRYLYFQALQLILRLQIKALLHEIPGLPQEIEPICRDLWALYVSQKTDLIAQPLIEQAAAVQAGDVNPESSSQTTIRRSAQAERDALLQQEREESERLQEQLEEFGVFEGELDELTSHSDATTERRATDSEWESFLDQDSEEDDKKNVFAPKKRRRPAKKATKSARNEGKVLQRRNRDDIDDLLSIIHLGLITLRIPITWTDLCILIQAGKLPYLNIVHQLPQEMVIPFPAREVRKLDPTRVPSIQKLHRRTAALATDLYEMYGIEFPELNSLPILWRYVERMLLPPTFYTAAKALLGYVGIPMHTVPPHSAAGPHTADDDVESCQRSIRPTLDGRLSVNLGRKSTAKEIIIMAAVVVIAKMRYGLDGEERHESFDDPMLWSGAPELGVWLQSLNSQERDLLNDHRAMYEAQGLDLLDMDEPQLDAYLDYAERTLILSQRPSAYKWRRREGINDLLSSVSHLQETYSLDMEPPAEDGEIRGKTLDQKMENVKKRLAELYNDSTPWIPPYIALTSNQPRPGDAHSLYSPKETSQSFFPDYVSVLHHASSIVGCQEAEMIDTVHAVEICLIKTLVWRKKTREAAERERIRKEQGSKRPGRPRKVVNVVTLQEQRGESNVQS